MLAIDTVLVRTAIAPPVVYEYCVIDSDQDLKYAVVWCVIYIKKGFLKGVFFFFFKGVQCKLTKYLFIYIYILILY